VELLRHHELGTWRSGSISAVGSLREIAGFGAGWLIY
jgi:hypothetical protein